ncbi:serine/threonine-protein kinase [Amycolatopsis saalfeldensis]|uniref:Serine/threonine protein kinase n=1 Tax=Amycolatopsis saalfeldensis TaxID=394193 RepID=A0A1H8YLW7_9PSEU|nr:serine/threonine-protein kinase [Amycolatopsis saalfeldensis]SEP53146.1 Serine/threonine protein kinase [Amycolatopsis saalfeldensis]
MKALGPADPRTVGRYRVHAELGRGGMGRVLLGSTADGRLVAIKLMHAQPGTEEDFRARFRREIDASRAVSGTYTAAVMDADPEAPAPWLVSVFVPGPPLNDVVAGTGPLPEEPVRRLAAGLAAALLDIHRAGLVHRDLKPSNVLLAADGPRVIDFGIARAADGPDQGGLTQTGYLIGTPEYMSPEQVGGQVLTPASDVFCLGSVLVHAATGRNPFSGGSPARTLYNVAHGLPVLTGLSPGLDHLVRACLAKDPAARPSPAQLLDLAGELPASTRVWPVAVHRMIAAQQAEAERFHHAPEQTDVLERIDFPAPGGTFPQPGPGSRPGATPPVTRRRKRWPVLTAGAVVAALAVTAVVLVALKGNGPDAVAGPRTSTAVTTPPASVSAPPPSVDRYTSLRTFAQNYVEAANEDAAKGKADRVKGFHCGSDQVGWVYLNMSVDRSHPRAELQDVQLVNDQAGAATVGFSQSPGADPIPVVKLRIKAQGANSWCAVPW